MFTKFVRGYASAPRLAQGSILDSIIPKYFRQPRAKRTGPRPWNPATFYIVMLMLVGSQSIQLIALRNEYAAYTRRADTRIRLLREAIESLNRGEKVDVEALLGTGDPKKEEDWEDFIKEIAESDILQQVKQRGKPEPTSGSKSEPKPEPKLTSVNARYY